MEKLNQIPLKTDIQT